MIIPFSPRALWKIFSFNFSSLDISSKMKFSSQFHSIFPNEQCYHFQLKASISCAMRLFTFFMCEAFFILLLFEASRRKFMENVLLFRKRWCWMVENFIIKFALVHISCSVSHRPPSCSSREKDFIPSSFHKLDFLLSDKWICLSNFFVRQEQLKLSIFLDFSYFSALGIKRNKKLSKVILS